MNRTIMAISMAVVAVSLSFNSAYAELDFEIEPYIEGNGFSMGYAYYCGAEYSYASGLTILTIAQTDQGDYVSTLGYYDEDYELVVKYEFIGNTEVMQSIAEYWEDRYLSSIC